MYAQSKPISTHHTTFNLIIAGGGGGRKKEYASPAASHKPGSVARKATKINAFNEAAAWNGMPAQGPDPDPGEGS